MTRKTARKRNKKKSRIKRLKEIDLKKYVTREVRAGLALGITTGILLFLLGVIAWRTGYGTKIVLLLGDLLSGYTTSLTGSIIGGAWGLSIGFITGYALLKVYQKVK